MKLAHTFMHRSGVVLAATALLSAFAGSVAAQKPAPKKSDPEIKALADRLADCVKDRKFARDAEGVECIDKLLVKLQAGVADKDQKIIDKALDGVLKRGKLRPPESPELYFAAVEALAYCGEEGAKILQKSYDSSRFPDKKPWVPLRERMLRSIGKTKDESKIKFLLDEARRNPEDALMAAAGEALGNYDKAKEALRKEIVDDLLKRWGSLDTLASQLGSGNIQAANARNTLAAIGGKWNDTLSKLTGQNFNKFLDWQNWNNKNRGKPWN